MKILLALLVALLASLPARADKLTYFRDIAPLLGAKCLGCHGAVPQGAPFSLATYADVVAHGDQVQQSVRDRSMPPFSIDNSGSCGSFTNTIWLTDSEIATISDWVDASMPAGSPEDAVPVPQPEGISVLDHVDVTIGMKKPYKPSSKEDEIRCFLIDAPTNKDTFLTGFNVIPGDAGEHAHGKVAGKKHGASVHHVVMWIPDYWGQWIAAWQSIKSRGMGYPCYSTAETLAFPAAVWAPGAGAVLFPQDTGVPIPANRKMILQVHYSPVLSGGEAPGPSRTQIQLQLEQKVEKPLEVILPGRISGVTLPPQQESTAFERSWDVIPKEQEMVRGTIHPFKLYGVHPHMHLYGHDEQLEQLIGQTGETVCRANAFRWDFGHQRSYLYDKPVEFAAGDKMTIRCRYNTMSTQTPIEFGEGSDKEMCILGMFVGWQ